MPMVNLRAAGDPNDELLAKGVADFGVAMINNITNKRLNDERTFTEQRINDAGSFQDALSVIESAPHRVKENFHNELLQRAQARFPEQELIDVLDKEGTLRSVTQDKGRPLTDEDLAGKGFERAQQHLIVSTDPKSGEIEIHDSALGMQAAGEDLERFQAMFPDRIFQITQAPENETFMAMKEQQLRAREIRDRRQPTNTPSVAERQLDANIRAEMQNDPLVTENGATVLESKRKEISDRFNSFNGQFAAGVFSLENPESAALVQNGIATTSQLIGRGYNLERATNTGFNVQIANSVVKNLLEGNKLDNGVAQETQKRFGVNPQALSDAMQSAAGSQEFQQMEEFDPKSTDPDVLDVNLQGQNQKVTIRFIKVNGRLVPLGKV